MNMSARDILRKLGEGEPISAVCAAAGWTREEFQKWWQAEARARVPATTGRQRAGVQKSVRLERDERGIPHIFAENDADLFFGFGYALAQDRLFQLDYLRRRGSGRMAEIFGGEGAELDLLSRIPGFKSVFELDLLARTVGLRRIAGKAWTTLGPETRGLLEAFAAGVNEFMSQGLLPIEFDLLDYKPEPWSPVDCLTIEAEFAWYLTGRFPVIAVPELAKRALGDGPLFRAFLQVEADDESILPAGSYPLRASAAEKVGPALNLGSGGHPELGLGSNNWVLAGSRTTSGKPMVATDPHIAFDAVSCWYEVHLCGGSFNVAGACYVGMPAVMFGRNEKVGWGCTNNICSQRDLYQEKTDPAHPDCFLYDGQWEPARTLTETIRIKNQPSVEKAIRFSRNGPIVDEVLPPYARQTGPVSLRWLGAHHGGWLTALLAMNRARSAAEFRQALRPWHVPTFSMVFADMEGHIGYQATGRIPIRKAGERGYRPGWEPQHQWQGLVPFEDMPHLFDPERGWMATANNRPAPDDFPYPLAGTWNEGMRAWRIRQLIEDKPKFDKADHAALHLDSLSLRAVRCVGPVIQLLENKGDGRLEEALGMLRGWDGRCEPELTAPTIFEAFFQAWTGEVARARFDATTAAILSGSMNGLSAGLLLEDAVDWFAAGQREQAAVRAMQTALERLSGRLGPDMKAWQWGKVHTLTLRHILSGRGDLGTLLDHGGAAVPGNMHTVCNTGLGPNLESRTGATYRHLADLGSNVLYAVDSQSESGHPGSPHYGDQFTTWLRGEYFPLSLDRNQTTANCTFLEPKTLEHNEA